MNSRESSALRRLHEAIALMLRGSLRDAREVLATIHAPDDSALQAVVAGMAKLADTIIDELVHKESSLSRMQAAMWELETTKENLRTNEARFRTTLESIGDGLISTDVGGRVEFMNAVAERLTG